jgi:16S rRNA (guanine527-N7)-methyltransferase
MWRGAAPSPPEAFRARLAAEAPRFGLGLSEVSLDQMARYLALLDLSRRRTNLTGRLGPEDLIAHALESALGERLIPHGAEVIDIGSGAGFPGVPLAIVRPDIRVTPVEPRRKRVEFLRHVAEQVPVENLLAPETGLRALAPGFAYVATARAVGSVERLLGDARFLRPDGLFLAWTTDASSLARRLFPRFSLEEELPVPESRRKVIASFHRTGTRVPRGTERKNG